MYVYATRHVVDDMQKDIYVGGVLLQWARSGEPNDSRYIGVHVQIMLLLADDYFTWKEVRRRGEVILSAAAEQTNCISYKVKERHLFLILMQDLVLIVTLVNLYFNLTLNGHLHS